MEFMFSKMEKKFLFDCEILFLDFYSGFQGKGQITIP